jgi:hypothetical protein
MTRGTKSRAVPLVVCEEHHEAFFVWNYAVRKGWIPAEGNTLMHFDEHADTALPRLRTRAPVGADLKELAAWVYSELRIDDFIVPALHQGLFDRFEWFRGKDWGAVRRARVFTASVNGAGTKFMYGQWGARVRRNPPADARLSLYRTGDVGEAAARRRNVVLDFDLDYFMCQSRPVFVDRRIYLTTEEFERLRGNCYHFLFTAPGAHVRLGAEGGKHFLEFGEPQAAEGEGGDTAVALQRIEQVASFLSRQSWSPRLIVVARSRHSGYTPAEHWRMLEDSLLAKLRGIYRLEMMAIGDLQAPKAPP